MVFKSIKHYVLIVAGLLFTTSTFAQLRLPDGYFGNSCLTDYR